MTRRHDNLVDLVHGLFNSLGLESTKFVHYDKGEQDVNCMDTYFEIKSNYNPFAVKRAQIQIKRAIKEGQCSYGYLVTPQGVYDVLCKDYKI